jgi:hypothetical protein
MYECQRVLAKVSIKFRQVFDANPYVGAAVSLLRELPPSPVALRTETGDALIADKGIQRGGERGQLSPSSGGFLPGQ